MNLGNLKEVSKKEGGILAQLWREIVIDNKLNAALKYLLDMYERKGGKRNKNTINASFTAQELTWKNFTFLVLKILPVKKLVFYLSIELPDYDPDKKEIIYYKSDHKIEITESDVDKKKVGEKLAMLRDDIIKKNNLENALKVLIDDYEERGGGKNKSSIHTQLTVKTITWKTLVFILTELLLIKEMKICAEVHFISGNVTNHCLTVSGLGILERKSEEEQKNLLTAVKMLKSIKIDNNENDKGEQNGETKKSK
jgi:hypothetical protein